jgi:hypothetical protein
VRIISGALAIECAAAQNSITVHATLWRVYLWPKADILIMLQQCSLSEQEQTSAGWPSENDSPTIKNSKKLMGCYLFDQAPLSRVSNVQHLYYF